MSKTTTAPRVRQTNLYTVEQDGQPVAQALAISQAEAVSLWIASQQQPTLCARLSSPIEARALAGLPLLTRGASVQPDRDPRVPDMFEDAPAAAGPARVADHVVGATEMVPAPAADHVAHILHMVPPQHAPIEAVTEGLASGLPAAEQPGEPAEPVALDATAPAGVEQARSSSSAAAVPAQPDGIWRQVRELAMLLGCERPGMAVETPPELVDLLQQHGLNEFNGRGHDLCRLFWQHYYPTAATANPNGTALDEAMAGTAPALMLPAERVSHAYATGYRLGVAGNGRWSAEWRVANDAEREGMSDRESMETHDAMISGTSAGAAAFEAKTKGAGSEPQRQAPAAAERQVSYGKVPVKYRNAATGESWTGRGLRPRWLVQALEDGKTLADFLADGVAA